MKDTLQLPEDGNKEGEHSGPTNTIKNFFTNKCGTKTTNDRKVEIDKNKKKVYQI